MKFSGTTSLVEIVSGGPIWERGDTKQFEMMSFFPVASGAKTTQRFATSTDKRR